MSSENRRARNRGELTIDALEGRALMSAGLQRGGLLDVRGSQRDDVIEVRIAPTDPTRIQVVENARITWQGSIGSVAAIRIQGKGGNDRIVVDETYGAITLSVKIDGGSGSDTMRGGSGDDEILGDSGRDVLLESAGTDTNRNVRRPDALVRFGSATAFRDFLAKTVKGRTSFGNGTWRSSKGGPAIAMPTIGGDSLASGAAGHSQTNTQVAGIDEGDLIENDGRNLYILSRGELLVVDAANPEAMNVRSRTTVEGSPVAIYLHDGRLTVISTRWKDTVPAPGDRAIPMLRVRGTGEVVVSVYDTTGDASPSLVSRTSMDGWYADSRMVDGKLALIVQNDLLVGYWGGPIAMTARLASPGVKPVSDNALNRLMRKTSMNSLLPGLSTSSYGPGGGATRTTSGLISQPQDILAPLDATEPNLLSVVLIQTGGATPGVIGTTSVVGGYASSIYMNATDLYLFGPRWDTTGERTQVQRLDISGNTPSVVATGSFEGHLLNQFSADASGEYLRVATTRWTSTGTVNAVSVLKTEGETIRQVGVVDGIAPGERIMSARFIDDRVYLVTFAQVDPLFTVDLSDPTAPKVLGELKIPGFSRYLQPFSDGYLLGIGRDADPATGRTRGLKLSLFDVREDTAPKELASYLVDTPANGWSWSDAEWDHHALGYFPELGIVAVPVQSQGPWGVRPDGTQGAETKSDLMLFRVGVDSGITLLGTVSHDSPLLRSARIGDVIYSVADLDLKAVAVLAESFAMKGAIELQQPWSDGGSGGGVVVAM